MRIALFGATGSVGSALLVHMLKGSSLTVGDEIVLVGRGSSENVAILMAMRSDLLDAFDVGSIEIVISPSLLTLPPVDVFIMAAGETISDKNPKRSDLAAKNIEVFKEAASALANRSPDAFVLIISNPVELATAVFAQFLDSSRVVGVGAQQDSLRFARAIAVRLGLPRAAVRASVLGQHGEWMIPIWSSVYLIHGHAEDVERLERLREACGGPSDRAAAVNLYQELEGLLNESQVDRAYSLLSSLAPEMKIKIEPLITTHLLHSTPNATANATMDCLSALLDSDDRKVHGQVLLRGEFYGLSGVLGVPLNLRKAGWKIASFEPLSDTELKQIEHANREINRLNSTDLVSRSSSRVGSAQKSEAGSNRNRRRAETV